MDLTILHAAKAEMVGAGADLAPAARADDVARAVLIGAEKRPAAMDLLGLLRLGRIERRDRAARIACDAACRRELRIVIGTIPVADPLPDVSRHVVEAVRIRGKLRDRREACEAVLAAVAIGKVS